MAASVWKGSISFGLVSVPVRLYAAARPSRISLHQLHRECHTRLRQPLFCPTDNRIVDRSEVVKGYEYEKDKYVLIEPEDIKRIEPESARTMDILSFAKASEIDPLYFDSSYFVVPEDQGRKAYLLLRKTLEDSHRVGIAKLAMHQREYTVFIRPYDQGLALHTMYFANEVREVAGYGKVDGTKISPQEVKLAEQLVSTLSKPFDVKQCADGWVRDSETSRSTGKPRMRRLWRYTGSLPIWPSPRSNANGRNWPRSNRHSNGLGPASMAFAKAAGLRFARPAYRQYPGRGFVFDARPARTRTWPPIDSQGNGKCSPARK